MTDWPGVLSRPNSFILSTTSDGSMFGDIAAALGVIAGAGAWAAANRAIYTPVMLEVPATAYKMAFIVGVQAGNYDVAILDEYGNVKVSLGSTPVPAAGLAVADIADTFLTPGVYLLGMNCSTLTTLTVNRYNIGISNLQMCGVMSQDVGATAIPNPATLIPANAAIVPALSVALTAVI